MKIALYTQRGCAHCITVKGMLGKMLPEFGLEYSSTVSEVDIDGAEVLAELIMMGAESVPVIVVGSESLFGPSAFDEGCLRRIIAANLGALKGQRE
jgi:glutaredoxin